MRYDEYIHLMNLSNWEIDIIEEPTLEVNGQVKMIYNDYKAIIKIKKDLSVEEKEKAVVHELVHLIHRDELDMACENIENKTMADLYQRFHERSIEQMAKIIYKLKNMR
ncbi:ImmA/IrrE family metallo-endopeptidase [Anaerosolibacter sp.]|uniref:ImmA/IrrE family metallo-endopeptidase n=1 Tax=Anaerosolibacter sp. TaxID=1872527 RepID=UPI0039F07A8D